MISIVTVVKNDKIGLEKTIDSVSQQTYQLYEHLIIDSVSTDGTFEYLSNLKIKNLKWISENDEGIYDAMNKGVKLAKGWIIMLNAGDTLYSNTVLKKISIYLIDKNSVYFGQVRNYSKILPISWIYPEISIKNSRPPHQGLFIHKDYHDNFRYLSWMKISADRYLIDISLAKTKKIFLGEIITNLELGGISNSYESIKQTMNLINENKFINKNQGNSNLMIFKTSIRHLSKYFLRLIFGKKLFQRIIWRKFYKKD